MIINAVIAIVLISRLPFFLILSGLRLLRRPACHPRDDLPFSTESRRIYASNLRLPQFAAVKFGQASVKCC